MYNELMYSSTLIKERKSAVKTKADKEDFRHTVVSQILKREVVAN